MPEDGNIRSRGTHAPPPCTLDRFIEGMFCQLIYYFNVLPRVPHLARLAGPYLVDYPRNCLFANDWPPYKFREYLYTFASPVPNILFD